MNQIIRNSIAFISGVIVGSIVNMGLITIGSRLIPPPSGVDVMDMESLKSLMHLFETKHFLFPFVGHAIGTFVGAYTASRIVVKHKMRFALAIGVFFLIGGIINTFILPSPVWFSILDLGVAYIPMGWLAGSMTQR